eukprot:5048513-Pyramimonas_sp.AAC.1
MGPRSGGSAVSGHPSSTTTIVALLYYGWLYPTGGGLSSARCLSLRSRCATALPPKRCLVCCWEHPLWD